MTRYAALLRGINVGRNRRIAMADLRALLTEEGYGNVATLLQSGNVVLDAEQPPTKLVSALEGAIERRFGMAVGVVVRTKEELDRIVAGDPLADQVTDGSRYAVWFLAKPVPAAVAEALAAVDLQDDRYVVTGREIYGWLPHGQLDSPVATAMAKLKGLPTITNRNWNTVRKLLAMMD
ncbi:DUF1697 domain-containing protein [Plantactinospora siamensis]|uniref:DUF1697 domain-containing protein n=2 Tax=Plantactinospora siamensis TaxID=555372 RepID=A0ABV6NYS9_9ACTN